MPGMSDLWYILDIFEKVYNSNAVNVVFILYSRAYWAPPDERSRLIGMSHSGGQIGNIVALLSGGYLCYIEFAGGWPSSKITFQSFINISILVYIIYTLIYMCTSISHHYI